MGTRLRRSRREPQAADPPCVLSRRRSCLSAFVPAPRAISAAANRQPWSHHCSAACLRLCTAQIENDKLRQVLKRELGDDQAVEKALASGAGAAPGAAAGAPWRGRAQQIIALKEKARGRTAFPLFCPLSSPSAVFCPSPFPLAASGG